MAVNVIGRSDIIKHVFDPACRLGPSDAKSDLVGVLIYRETRSLKCSEIEHVVEYSSNIRANKLRKGST